MLDLNHLRDRPISKLSGGELQRFAITLCCVAQADVYMFDEPSSYLDRAWNQLYFFTVIFQKIPSFFF